MALDFPVASDFPGGVIPDGEKYEGFYWDAATGAWKRECDPDKIGDCLDTDNGETVCDRLEILDNQIVELEEEIDAIATSVDRGTWQWDFNVSSYLDARLGRGKFYMVRESDLAVTTEYSECGRVVFHEYDAEDDLHTFNDTMVDKVLMLFDRPDYDFLESVVTAVETTSGTQGTAYIVHVDHVQSKGSPTNKPDDEGRYKARLNIFDQPTGGSAGEYVKKIGDDMTGRLRIERDRETSNFDPPIELGEAHIRFRNTKADNTQHTAALFQPGPQESLVSTTEFMSKGDFTTHQYIKACWYYTHTSGDLRRTNKKATIYFHGNATDSALADQYGVLQFNASDRVSWNNSGGSLKVGDNAYLKWDSTHAYIPRVGTNARNGFQVKGTQLENYKSTTGPNGDLLRCYHNSGNSADAAFYFGKITDDNHIATKKYVDDKGGVDITCSATGKVKGDMWYCDNDQTLYLKVS